MMMGSSCHCSGRGAVTMVAVAFLIGTLHVSGSGCLALHIQPRLLTEHWLEAEAGSSLSDNTEAADQLSTTPPSFDTTDFSTVIPTTTDAAWDSDAVLSFADAIPKSARLPWEMDVDELLINIPSLSCPRGFRADLRGKCRRMFGGPMVSEDYERMLSPQLGRLVRPASPRGNTLP